MFFVAGITGKVGGAAARRLLADGQEVRSGGVEEGTWSHEESDKERGPEPGHGEGLRTVQAGRPPALV